MYKARIFRVKRESDRQTDRGVSLSLWSLSPWKGEREEGRERQGGRESRKTTTPSMA